MPFAIAFCIRPTRSSSKGFPSAKRRLQPKNDLHITSQTEFRRSKRTGDHRKHFPSRFDQKREEVEPCRPLILKIKGPASLRSEGRPTCGGIGGRHQWNTHGALIWNRSPR